MENWKKQFKEEFGIHFKGSSGELGFALAFIDDLLEKEKQELWLEFQDVIHRERDNYNKTLINLI